MTEEEAGGRPPSPGVEARRRRVGHREQKRVSSPLFTSSSVRSPTRAAAASTEAAALPVLFYRVG